MIQDTHSFNKDTELVAKYENAWMILTCGSIMSGRLTQAGYFNLSNTWYGKLEPNIIPGTGDIVTGIAYTSFFDMEGEMLNSFIGISSGGGESKHSYRMTYVVDGITRNVTINAGQAGKLPEEDRSRFTRDKVIKVKFEKI